MTGRGGKRRDGCHALLVVWAVPSATAAATATATATAKGRGGEKSSEVAAAAACPLSIATSITSTPGIGIRIAIRALIPGISRVLRVCECVWHGRLHCCRCIA